MTRRSADLREERAAIRAQLETLEPGMSAELRAPNGQPMRRDRYLRINQACYRLWGPGAYRIQQLGTAVRVEVIVVPAEEDEGSGKPVNMPRAVGGEGAGVAWPGEARLGAARLGTARRGGARQGKAGQGKAADPENAPRAC